VCLPPPGHSKGTRSGIRVRPGSRGSGHPPSAPAEPAKYEHSRFLLETAAFISGRRSRWRGRHYAATGLRTIFHRKVVFAVGAIHELPQHNLRRIKPTGAGGACFHLRNSACAVDRPYTTVHDFRFFHVFFSRYYFLRKTYKMGSSRVRSCTPCGLASQT
jgi:hypothetical protein